MAWKILRFIAAINSKFFQVCFQLPLLPSLQNFAIFRVTLLLSQII